MKYKFFCSGIGCMGAVIAKGLCKRCYAKEYDRKRYLKHGEKIRSKVRDYANKNKERVREGRALYYKNNSEAIKARGKQWRKDHPEIVADMKAAGRRRERDAEGRHDYRELKGLREKQRNCCAICKNPFGKKYHKDHIIPLVLGGTNWIHNIQYLCPSCNLQKNRQDPIEFMVSKGYLI